MMPLCFHYTQRVLPKVFKFGPNTIQKANIMGRGTRGGPIKLQKPFPYEDKKFTVFDSFFDNTLLRVTEENAKIIVVEGPIAAGKTALAKALAEEFDMLHIPEATGDDYFILPGGTDMRTLDHKVPKVFQVYDHKNFCCDPKGVRAWGFQYLMLQLRFYQYLDALVHILNTGQGVVLERSYYSDYVFAKAMHDQGFISKSMLDMYMVIRENTSTFFCNPHVVVYLDIPVPVVQERIRTRNYSYEQNSPALTKEYLTSLEKHWKDYLKEQSKKSEILIYDWSDGGEVELIVEDIEQFPLDFLHDPKFIDWRKIKRKWTNLRETLTNNKYIFDKFFKVFVQDCEELDLPPYLYAQKMRMFDDVPECQFDYGYNRAVGDSFWKILFSSRSYNHRMRREHIQLAAK